MYQHSNCHSNKIPNCLLCLVNVFSLVPTVQHYFPSYHMIHVFGLSQFGFSESVGPEDFRFVQTEGGFFSFPSDSDSLLVKPFYNCAGCLDMFFHHSGTRLGTATEHQPAGIFMRLLFHIFIAPRSVNGRLFHFHNRSTWTDMEVCYGS